MLNCIFVAGFCLVYLLIYLLSFTAGHQERCHFCSSRRREFCNWSTGNHRVISIHQRSGPIISMASHWCLKYVMEFEIMCLGVIWSINFKFYGILLRFFNIWSETPAERLLRKWLARRSLMLLRDGILIQLWNNAWVDIFAKWICYMFYIYIYKL